MELRPYQTAIYIARIITLPWQRLSWRSGKTRNFSLFLAFKAKFKIYWQLKLLFFTNSYAKLINLSYYKFLNVTDVKIHTYFQGIG